MRSKPRPNTLASIGLFTLLPLVIPTAVFAPQAFAQQTGGQQAGPGNRSVPIYRVTVVGRTTKAVNYQYRSGPTHIDIRGTVLLPQGKGEATVESKQGRTEIDAQMEGLSSSQRFGDGYLAYVLWAITPQGRPHNIGELIPNSSNRASLHVTTDLQAFALIVTAEPYSAVRQPSDVVVAENQIRPDTFGTIEPLEAKYELLPRGYYTLNTPPQEPAGEKLKHVSMHEWEALSALYQAQNAVAAARNAGAEQYASDTFARAEQLLAGAELWRDRKTNFRQVVQDAREAAQTAEDARVIADRERQANQLSAAHSELSKTQAELARAQQAKQQALDQAHQAEVKAAEARAQAANATVASNQAERDAAVAHEREQQERAQSEAIQAQLSRAQSSAARQRGQQEADLAGRREARSRLLEEIKGVLPTLDTARGVVATVADDDFRGAALREAASSHVAMLAAILSLHPDLHISVEGYSSDAAGEAVSTERAMAVRRVLVGNGVAPALVSAAGFGDSRPLGPNTSAQGRKANTRVEIVINGDSIGHLALWELTYSLNGSGQQ